MIAPSAAHRMLGPLAVILALAGWFLALVFFSQGFGDVLIDDPVERARVMHSREIWSLASFVAMLLAFVGACVLAGRLWRRQRVWSSVALLIVLGFVVAVGVANADVATPRTAVDVVQAARQQVGVTRSYDPAYRRMAYPGGDVPRDRGVCTDVLVRALRDARGLDLQRAVHEDVRAHASAYPLRRWGRAQPDSNIDHRRVPNLMIYFSRAGQALPTTQDASTYRPGDIVAWDLGGGVLHVGIVSDRRASTGVPLVIHNIGRGTQEEDVLFRFRILGHYRL